jgi:hypothetical protein
MGRIIDLKDAKRRSDESKEHSKKTDYAKFLIEHGEECGDFEPAHFCLIAAGHSMCGGSSLDVFFSDKDKNSLYEFVGMLESVKLEALAMIMELE